MSILKYCKHAPVVQDEELPESSSCLSNVVLAKAIEMANSEFVKVKNKTPRGSRSAPYLILTPAQRYEVGKRAAEHGVTVALRYFAKKYPELPFKETSAQRFKNLYQSDCKPLLLLCWLKKFKNWYTEKKVDHYFYLTSWTIKFKSTLKNFVSMHGVAINSATVIATAQGIVMNKDANLLSCNGGGINLTTDWTKLLLTQMNFYSKTL